MDWLLDSLRDRYGWSWLNQDPDAWKTINPSIAKKIEELDARLSKLEGKK